MTTQAQNASLSGSYPRFPRHHSKNKTKKYNVDRRSLFISQYIPIFDSTHFHRMNFKYHLSSFRFDQVFVLIVEQMYVEIWSKTQVTVKIYISIWTFGLLKQHDHHLPLIRRISSEHSHIEQYLRNQWHIYADLLSHVKKNWMKCHKTATGGRYIVTNKWPESISTFRQHDFPPWWIYPD